MLCGATGVLRFSCVASAAHFLFEENSCETVAFGTVGADLLVNNHVLYGSRTSAHHHQASHHHYHYYPQLPQRLRHGIYHQER